MVEADVSEDSVDHQFQFDVIGRLRRQLQGRTERLSRLDLWSDELDLAFLEAEEPNPAYVWLKEREARYGTELAVAEHRMTVTAHPRYASLTGSSPCLRSTRNHGEC